MTKKLLLFLTLSLLVFSPFISKGQQDTTQSSKQEAKPEDPSKWGIKFGGFVNTQIFWDTRQSVSARETMLLLYPKNVENDAEGNDINAAPSMNQLSIISRISGAISGPDVLGAQFRGLLEADFSGQSDGSINLFRLRHAFIALDWKHHDFLIGQTWHPMNVPEMMPGLSPLNNGAPFHPFSRHVQVRYAYKIEGFRMVATAAGQRDNSSPGPKGGTSEYIINSAIPNFDLQFQYRIKNHFFGAGADWKAMKPRLVANFDTSTYKQTDLLSSWAAIVFWNYKMPAWNLKVEGIWGQNQYEHLMLGGMAEMADPINHTYNYTNIDQVSAWAEIVRSVGKWRPGLFVGYAKVLGFSKDLGLSSRSYGRGVDMANKGNDIDHVYRISPRLSFYPSKRLIFTAETEYTVAGYGEQDRTTGKVHNAKDVGMFRFFLDATYNF